MESEKSKIDTVENQFMSSISLKNSPKTWRKNRGKIKDSIRIWKIDNIDVTNISGYIFKYIK